MALDKDLDLKKLPDPWGEKWPDIEDLLYNLQRVMGHLMAQEGCKIAGDTLWWADQGLKNLAGVYGVEISETDVVNREDRSHEQ